MLQERGRMEARMTKVLDGEIIAPEAQAKTTEKVKGRFWPTFRKAIRQIPFSQDLVAAYYCAIDPATPTRVRGVLLGALAYFILPFDAVPDFIAGLGYGDDIGVLVAAIAMVGANITDAHRARAREALAEERE
jgi:uncharacterized membrane protein YkvA (DUF1232 family)